MRNPLSPIVRVLAVLAAASQVVPSTAQVNPPSWWGQQDGFTSFFGWRFDQPDFPPVPDLAWQPFGAPSWNVSGHVGWKNQVTDHQGVWGIDLGIGTTGEITVLLPNARLSEYFKHVWLQVDFFESAPVGSDVSLVVQTEQSSTIGNITESVVALGAGWHRSTVEFTITPQPNWESFTFQFIAGPESAPFIDNLYIGTHCEPVPEPATLTALGIGLAALTARRRARH
jgi:hypothetical protein